METMKKSKRLRISWLYSRLFKHTYTYRVIYFICRSSQRRCSANDMFCSCQKLKLHMNYFAEQKRFFARS